MQHYMWSSGSNYGQENPCCKVVAFPTMAASVAVPSTIDGVTYSQYTTEESLPEMMKLFAADLSEPYSVFTYRYFLHQWPELAYLVGCCCSLWCPPTSPRACP